MEHREYIRHVPDSSVAVLMVHGIAGTPNHFRLFMERIPESWSVYNLLLPGHGKEVRDFGRSSMARWKTHVSQRLDRILEEHGCVLILAHSMGSLFAIEEAVARPGAIAGLFLLNCPVRIHYPPRSALLSLRTALGSRAEACCQMRDACSICLTPLVWRYLCWIPRFLELLREIAQVRKLLPRLETPTVCFHSGADQLVSPMALRELKKHPGIRTELLQKSNHFAYLPEDEAVLLQEWCAFAERLTGKKYSV